MEIKEIEHAHDDFFRGSMQNKEIALSIVQCCLDAEILN